MSAQAQHPSRGLEVTVGLAREHAAWLAREMRRRRTQPSVIIEQLIAEERTRQTKGGRECDHAKQIKKAGG
jgi:hypothetical protein